MPIESLKLTQLIRKDRILDLDGVSKEDVLRRLCYAMAQDQCVRDEQALYNAIVRREQQISTGVGMGIAIPHVKIPQVNDYIAAAARVSRGVDFQALDGQPVYLVFMIGASDRQTKEFVRILAHLTHLLKSDEVRHSLLRAQIPDEFYSIIEAYER